MSSSNYLPTLYQNYIYKSRYAKWLWDKNRRETWEETVGRYFDFFEDHLKVNFKHDIKPYRKELEEAVLSLKIMPSMRALMTAGEALKKSHIAGFNCSYRAVNNPRAFDEIHFILLNGTGVGFSVEQKEVDQLPTVAEDFHDTDTTIIVADSKLGWAKALKELIHLLYSGQVPKFDVSKVRPAGAPLKTFGGRASGPAPLVDLFNYCITKFKNAAGRRLSSIECHDIVCKIAETVVVGGVRRCLYSDASVQTTKGFQAIKNIKVGDKIVTGGKAYRVIEHVNSGKQKLLTIKHRFGVLECTENHEVAVFDSIGNYIFKPAKEIRIGDRLVWDTAGVDGEIQNLPGKITEEIHFNEKSYTIPAFLNDDLAWLFGYIHGGGSIQPKGIVISGNIEDQEPLRKAERIFKDYFGVSGVVAPDFKNGKGYRLGINSVQLSEWFKKYIKASHIDIQIPEFIIQSTRSNRAAYLAGLFDADGRIGKDSKIDQYTTVYPKYTKQVVSLLSTLGIAAGVGHRNRRSTIITAQTGNEIYQPAEVIEIIKNKKMVDTYDIEVEDIHQFTTDGIVVHNSALISLSDLNDDSMRSAKSGQWWIEQVQRALANNSAVYKQKPDVGLFMDEWKALYESKSGERGIFNRQAVKKHLDKNGRRESDFNFGLNPCLSKDMLINTTNGLRSVESLIGQPFEAVVYNEKFSSSGFIKTGTHQLYKVETQNGYEFRATLNHRILVGEDWKELKDCVVGDLVNIGKTRIDHVINKEDFDHGWLLGEVIGDGCYNPDKYKGLVRFWGNIKETLAQRAFEIVDNIKTDYSQPVKPISPVYNHQNQTLQIQSLKIDRLCEGLIDYNKNIQPQLEQSSPSLIAGVISGLFDSDGCVGGDPKKKGIYLQLTSINKNNLKAVQRMLLVFGITSRIQKMVERKSRVLPDGKGGKKEYPTQQTYRLDIGRDNLDRFQKYIGFCDPEKRERLNTLLKSRVRPPYKTEFTTKITSIIEDGIEDVYDCSVPNAESFVCNGIVVHNCGEIFLRDSEFCNLSEAIIRSSDSEEDISNKIRLATILGTWQSTLTDFKYISKKWKENCEEERLLGVSLTGIMDCELTNGKKKGLEDRLNRLKALAIQTNKEYTKKINISESKAVTCIKPSGTVSQLTDASSGIHARHSPYYIRTVRADKKDPLALMMKDMGFPVEDDVTKPDSTYVFLFPIQSPKNAIFRNDMSAVDQLELWLIYKTHWTEHNPSVTVSVREQEWLDVGAWVYNHFDDMTGVSFLPMSDHVYRQAPYQDCSKEEYDALVSKMPKVIDWAKLSEYEKQDSTVASQELACAAGGCEI